MVRVAGLTIAVALFSALSTNTAKSQTASPQTPVHAERKAVSKVAPVYPELAKRVHLGGVVKLEVIVRPDGKVKSTKALGGSPLLIQPAVDAVQRWKFEAAPTETTETVQIFFDQSQ